MTFFWDGLPSRFRDQAIREMQQLDPFVDAYVTHSEFYATKMSDLLQLPRAKISVIPLGLNVPDIGLPAENTTAGPLVVGYLARIDPPKGLHLLCQAIRGVIADGKLPTRSVELRVAGYLADGQREYLESSLAQVTQAGGDAAYVGELDRAQKFAFLQSLDVFCVPSPYREPKALYLLEAMACGVPVVSPAHGVFPEMLTDTEGGVLFTPNDIGDLADTLCRLLADSAERRRLGEAGRDAVQKRRSSATEAERFMELLRRL